MHLKYLIFGTGDYYERYKKWFHRDEVVALLDNSKTKQNTIIDGIMVLSPEEGIKLDFDRIIILSFYVKAMKQQMLDLNVSEDCIFHFYDLHQIIDIKKYPDNVQYYGEADKVIEENTDQYKILLLSQDLTLGGPAIALMHVAEVLLKRGISVVYGSMLDGPLREKLMEKNISVIVDEKLQIATMNEIDWVRQFSGIICNTINFHVFLSNRDTNIPILWWLHDAEFFYDGVNKELLQNISKENLKVVSVGYVPQRAIQKFVPELVVEPLLYGVADVSNKKMGEKKHEKIRFVTIGFWEDIKGQDLLVQAVELLPDESREMLEVLLVGHDATLFGQHVKEMSKKIPEIEFSGSVNRERIHEILNNTDVLICPSRQDSMPTVAAEAMMHSVPCIVSDVTGTASYIRNGVDGFVFESEAVSELAEKMEWCIRNKDKLSDMGIKARRLYEKFFSMEAFEHELLRVVNDTFSKDKKDD